MRQLLLMAEGAMRDDWLRTATHIACMLNVQCCGDKFKPSDFMPFDDDESHKHKSKFVGWTDKHIQDFESLKKGKKG